MKKYPWLNWFNKSKANMAIVQDGDTATRAISSGKYVVWKNDLYKANGNINSGATFVSGTNLTPVTDGGLNSLSDNLANKINTSAIANNLTTTSEGYVLDARQGKALNDKIIQKASVSATINSGTSKVVSYPSGYSRDNCAVISVSTLFNNVRYWEGRADLQSGGVALYNVTGTGSGTVRAILMKIS